MLTAEKEIDSCCNPTNKDGEHSNTLYVSVCVPPSVEFCRHNHRAALKTVFLFSLLFSLELLATRNNFSSQ